MRIVIPGEPRGKQRPRFSRRTGATYTPSETVQYEKAVKALLREFVNKVTYDTIK